VVLSPAALPIDFLERQDFDPTLIWRTFSLFSAMKTQGLNHSAILLSLKFCLSLPQLQGDVTWHHPSSVDFLSAGLEPPHIQRNLAENMVGDPRYVNASKLPYMRLVGFLLYVMTCTIPDIFFPTTVISRFMTKPLYVHWLACLYLVRYLKGTVDVDICFCRENWLEHFMVGFSDSDWAYSDLEHRRSMTGYSVIFCSGLIAWRSCLQTTVAKSATEAEYCVLSNFIDEVTFMKQLLLALCIEIETVQIYEDNKGEVDLAGKPV
jgi:hypothetical protein